MASSIDQHIAHARRSAAPRRQHWTVWRAGLPRAAPKPHACHKPASRVHACAPSTQQAQTEAPESDGETPRIQRKTAWHRCTFDTWTKEQKITWINVNRSHAKTVKWLQGSFRDEAKIGSENGRDMCDPHSVPSCRGLNLDSSDP